MFVGHMTTVRGGTKEVTKTKTVLPYTKITNVKIGSTSSVDATISVTPTLGHHTSTVYGTTVTRVFNQTTTAYAGTKEVTKTVTVPYDTEISFATPSSTPTVSLYSPSVTVIDLGNETYTVPLTMATTVSDYSPSVSIHDMGNETYIVTLSKATTFPHIPSTTSATVPLTMSTLHSSMHPNASTTVALTLPTTHPYTHSNASATVKPTISTSHLSEHSNTSTVSHHTESSGVDTSSPETTTVLPTSWNWTTYTSVSQSTIGTIRNGTLITASTSTLSTPSGPAVPLSTTHAPSFPTAYLHCNKTVIQTVTVSRGTDATSTSLRTTVVPCNKASTHTVYTSVHTLTGHTLTSAPTATTTSITSHSSSKLTSSDSSLTVSDSTSSRTSVPALTLYSTETESPMPTPAITSVGPLSAVKQSAWQFTFSETYSVAPNPFQGKGSRAMGTAAGLMLAGVLEVALFVL
jgi:hypothetical protein